MLESEIKKLTNQIETLNINIAKLISVQESSSSQVTMPPPHETIKVEFPKFNIPETSKPEEVETPKAPEKPTAPAIEPPGQVYGHSTREDLPANVTQMPPGMTQPVGVSNLPPGTAPPVTSPSPVAHLANRPLGDIQAYAVRRAGEISAHMGTSDPVTGLMEQYGISDLTRTSDDKLKFFLDILEKMFATHWK